MKGDAVFFDFTGKFCFKARETRVWLLIVGTCTSARVGSRHRTLEVGRPLSLCLHHNRTYFLRPRSRQAVLRLKPDRQLRGSDIQKRTLPTRAST